MDRLNCAVCGWRPRRGNGIRCNPCRNYYRRHGHDRTPEQINRAWELALDRLERVLAKP